MEYRVKANELFATLEAWSQQMPARTKVHLIACGGTALTLLGYKESTKDVDFLVPNLKEHEKLLAFLKRAGYDYTTGFGLTRKGELIVYDLFPGNKVYTTELLTSPLLEGGNKKIREWKKIYLGVLNATDLIISKIFRGHQVDMDDCLILLKNEKINISKLEERYKETATYEVGEEKVIRNFEIFKMRMREHGLL